MNYNLPALTEAELKELDEFLSDLDERMRAENVPIPRRPFRAWLEYGRHKRISSAFGGPLETAIHGWFLRIYGDRLKVDFTVGKMLVEVRGDLYVAGLPTIYGTVRLELPSVIEGSTLELFARAGQHAVDELIALIKRALAAFNILRRLPEAPLGDLRNAVDAASWAYDYGTAKWCSMLSVEKLVNQLLSLDGLTHRDATRRPAHQHDLGPAVELAEANGLPTLDRALLTQVECPAGVRYGRIEVTQDEAIRAHQAAVFLAADLATHLLSRRTPER